MNAYVEKGFNPDDLCKVSPDIEIVSQEGDEIVLAFVSTGALEQFESRLASLAAGRHVTYKTVLYALKRVDGWSPDDREALAALTERVERIERIERRLELSE